MNTGMNTGVGTGNPEEMLLGFSPSVNLADNISVFVPVRPAPKCGNQYWIIGADNTPRIVEYISEGTSRLFRCLLDTARTSHTVFALPMGQWPDVDGFNPLEDVENFSATRATFLQVEWDVGDAAELLEIQYEDGDILHQLIGLTVDGIERFKNCQPVPNSIYQGRIGLTMTKVSTTITVTLWNGATKVAEGSRTGDGAITLAEMNESGISGAVFVTYTSDVENAFVIKRWPSTWEITAGKEDAFATKTIAVTSLVLSVTTNGNNGYEVGQEVTLTFAAPYASMNGQYTVVSAATAGSDQILTFVTDHANIASVANVGTITLLQTMTFNDPGIGEHFSVMIGPLEPGTRTVTVTPTFETGIEGTALSGNQALSSGAPGAPGVPSYVSGDITNTVIEFAASVTAGATYRYYDCQELDGPTYLEGIAATRGSGTGTLQLTLPGGLTPLATIGERWGRLVAVSGGVEDAEQRKFLLKYAADGSIVVDVPNVPTIRVTSVVSRTATIAYTYDSTGEAGVATYIVLEREDFEGSVVSTEHAITSTDTIKTGSIQSTVSGIGVDGWHRFRAAAETDDSVVSDYSGWTDWVYLSNAGPAAPENLELTPIG